MCEICDTLLLDLTGRLCSDRILQCLRVRSQWGITSWTEHYSSHAESYSLHFNMDISTHRCKSVVNMEPNRRSFYFSIAPLNVSPFNLPHSFYLTPISLPPFILFSFSPSIWVSMKGSLIAAWPQCVHVCACLPDFMRQEGISVSWHWLSFFLCKQWK